MNCHPLKLLGIACMLVMASPPLCLAHATDLQVLYAFQGGADGEDPSNLVQDNAGNLYGAAVVRGAGGMIFKLTPEDTKTMFYGFTGGKDGSGPNGGLVMDGSGNIYGTTQEGGIRNLITVNRMAAAPHSG